MRHLSFSTKKNVPKTEPQYGQQSVTNRRQPHHKFNITRTNHPWVFPPKFQLFFLTVFTICWRVKPHKSTRLQAELIKQQREQSFCYKSLFLPPPFQSRPIPSKPGKCWNRPTCTRPAALISSVTHVHAYAPESLGSKLLVPLILDVHFKKKINSILYWYRIA